MVSHGSAHLATTTLMPTSPLTLKSLKKCHFQTIVGRKHPLYATAKSGKSLSVENLLEYPFVCPERGILGQLGQEQSTDGWRDDIFPLRI